MSEQSRHDPGCCSAAGKRATIADRIATSFDRQVGRTVSDPDVLPEPSPISGRLLELLSDVSEARPSVLDLGCGTGNTSIRLARAGAGPVTGMDLSPVSIDIARRRAAAVGMTDDRVRFDLGDVTSSVLRPRDWVVLDRVICCYDDVDLLLTNALSGTRRRLAFAVPDSRGWRGVVNKMTWSAENLGKAVIRRPDCKGFVHDLGEIDRRLADSGLAKMRDSVRGLWYAAVYERAPIWTSRPREAGTA